MPVITFANTKGGAGKTTAVHLLTGELLRRGKSVTVIDCDPQCWISRWSEKCGRVPGLKIVSYVTARNIQEEVEAGKRMSDFVILDLPGACSPLLATALGFADHVIIPVQGCTMDAQGGAQVLELLAYLDKRANIRIPHSVLLTRVNSIVTTRALQAVKELLASRGVHVFSTPIIERAAFRDMFDHNGPLHTMDPERVTNLARALENAQCYADELLRLLPGQSVIPRTSGKRDAA
ncbi:ParA family protein [Ciceribacter sp. L1K23]|uniref:ParA family protein n=1 Tax=Ciceribacter sp. L1K23 TaxID=2820276 RepID=UPI001B810553|nr:ParA family protein [Ciceribacter sp. L1K23]MBR0557839.1 ParA family protein [Ciceribacter sp. L1K23]